MIRPLLLTAVALPILGLGGVVALSEIHLARYEDPLRLELRSSGRIRRIEA